MNDPLIFVRQFKETHIDLKNETGIEFGIGVSGKYLVEICRDGKVIRQPFGPKMRPNLITNKFFDNALTGSTTSLFRDLIDNARIGTGSTAPANTDTVLTAQTQSVASLFTGGGNTFSNDTVNGTWTGTWVFEFAAVGAGVTLNEAGLGGSAAGADLASHVLFPASVTLNSGDNLRLTYSFTYSVPCLVTQIPVSLSAVNGFNVSGNLKVVGTFASIFGTVSTGNTAVGTGGTGTLQDSQLMFGVQGGGGTLCSAPTVFPSVNTGISATAISGANGTSVLGTYTNGSFTRNETWTWAPSQPSSTVSNVNAINFAPSAAPASGLYLILTSAQTKANTNTLAITMSCTMARA